MKSGGSLVADDFCDEQPSSLVLSLGCIVVGTVDSLKADDFGKKHSSSLFLLLGSIVVGTDDSVNVQSPSLLLSLESIGDNFFDTVNLDTEWSSSLESLLSSLEGEAARRGVDFCIKRSSL